MICMIKLFEGEDCFVPRNDAREDCFVPRNDIRGRRGDERSFMLYFITGNEKKFLEVKLMLPEIEQLHIDLPEIQSTDGREIVEAKLREASNHHEGEFIVEDTGLYLKGLNGLPGPFIKWFLDKLGTEGVYKLAEKIGIFEAEAKTVVGYLDKNKEMYFFEGIIVGDLVPPRGEKIFGWDPIFKPKGDDRTFSEMSREQKNEISHRMLAIGKLKEFLTNK